MPNNSIESHASLITALQRSEQKQQQTYVVWITGLSGSGKSTLAYALEHALFERGHHSYVLDGDNLRHGLNQDLGFTIADRQENLRRVAEVAHLFIDAGLIVLASFISPFQTDRDSIKDILGQENVIEVYLDTPINVCEERDVKGLYKLAREGKINDFTGIDSHYEAPLFADLVINTHVISLAQSVDIVMGYLSETQRI